MVDELIVNVPHYKRYAIAFDERCGDYVIRWKEIVDGKWELFARVVPGGAGDVEGDGEMRGG